MASNSGQGPVGDGDDVEVMAAGGVVVDWQGNGPRIVVVHRPKYMDWTVPKGKLDRGEEFREAALREVLEETGLRCETGVELSAVRYLDRKARVKLVRYWLMRPIVGAGEVEPQDEVDEVRWVSASEAAELLSYDHDRELVDEALRVDRIQLRPYKGGSGKD